MDEYIYTSRVGQFQFRRPTRAEFLRFKEMVFKNDMRAADFLCQVCSVNPKPEDFVGLLEMYPAISVGYSEAIINAATGGDEYAVTKKSIPRPDAP